MTTTLDMMSSMEHEIARLRADNLRLVDALEAERVRLGMLRADLSRVTEDAAKECGRLRADLRRLHAELDALCGAALAIHDCDVIRPPRSSDASVLEKWRGLFAAVDAAVDKTIWER
jgi:hypothetical protein